MNHAWEKSVFEGNADSVQNEQRPGSLDHPEKKPPSVGSQPSGGGQQPLVLTPASLQLAQLQAQLTLQRMKLAQTAVGGSSAATAAASVLNQVLSNVAMSQSFLNQLRGPAFIGTAHGQAGGPQLGPRFPAGALAFPPPSAGLGPPVGGGFGPHNPNPGGMRLNCYGGGLPQPPGQQAPEYAKKAGVAFLPASQRGGDGPRPPGPDGGNQSGFQRDFFRPNQQGQPPAFTGEQISSPYPSGGQKDQQWQGFPQARQLDANAATGAGWAPERQPPFHARAELYNPEEPTPDPKYSSGPGAAGAQGFEAYLLQPGEDPFSAHPAPLQPHQLNDFHAVTPAQLPHQCTICDKRVYNLKDWDQHVKGKLHLQNRMLYYEGSAAGSANFPESSQGCLNTSLNSSVVYSSTANQDISSENNSPYVQAAPIMPHPLTGVGFTLPLGGLKFPQRKPCPGRVVHICNLPEGSCTENDVINLGLPFGKVTNYILMRSTHQAFLEMAYVEAAQAMVKYYQLNPAMINEQKLLIRMSKRYQELQLKKPGKDVESIIQDIHSQREMQQEIDCYPPERVRSRSPVSRSLSPRSHSPSCSSAHSPPGPCRPERSNGLGPRHPSWDWSSHAWQDDRDEACWRNGDGDLPGGGGPPQWRKAYFQATDRASPRTAEERAEGQRGGRDRYSRSSPQATPFRSKEEDFYPQEPQYRPDKPSRQAHQRPEARVKKRDTPENHRSRQSELEPLGESTDHRDSEDRRQTSPARVKRKSPDRKQEVEKVGEEPEDEQNKEKSRSILNSCENVEFTEPTGKHNETECWNSGEETEGEIWYPGDMEELVTVDEVGEDEEDSVIEPDLPMVRLEEPRGTTATRDTKEDSVLDEGTTQEGRGDAQPVPQKKAAGVSLSAGSEVLADVEWRPDPVADPGAFPDHVSNEQHSAVTTSDHGDACGGGEPMDASADCGIGNLSLITNETHSDDENPDVHSTLLAARQLGVAVIAAYSPSWEQEKLYNENSIPLGVEFIVPRSGFYCKLCGLFYTSEEKAKTTHCRSKVHYRNLQKYLSRLAEDGLNKRRTLTGPASAE